MILKVLNVSFRYGSIEALKNVTFEVRDGEVVSIIGPNGSGKTTLLRCVLAMLRPIKGAILLNEYLVSKFRPIERAKLMGYTPQVESPPQPITVFELVLLGRRPHIRWSYSDEDVKVVTEVLKELGIEDLAMRRVNELSGGEWRKVLIARALAQKPKILLLDEPTNHLDLKHQIEVLELINSLARKRGIAVLMAMHDVNLALRYSDKVIALKKGIITYCGPPNSLSKEVIEELYGVKVSILKDEEGNPIVIPKKIKYRTTKHNLRQS